MTTLPPEVETTPEEKPKPGVWWAILIILGLLAYSQIVVPITQLSRAKVIHNIVGRIEMELPPATLSHVVASKLAKDQDEEKHLIYEDDVSDLAPIRKESDEAGALYAILRFEEGKKIDADDIKFLRASKAPRIQVLGDLYGEEKIDQAQYDRIQKTLNKPKFSERIALLHAKRKLGQSAPLKDLFSEGKRAAFMLNEMVLGVTVLAGITVALVYGLGRTYGMFKPVGLPAIAVSRGDADRMGAFFLLILFLGFAAEVVAFTIAPKSKNPWLTVAVEVPTIFLCFSLLRRLPVFGRLLGMFKVGYQTRGLALDLATGFLGAVACVPITALCIALSKVIFPSAPETVHPLITEMSGMQSLPTMIGFLVLASVTTPFLEETMFRGCLFQGLSNVLGGAFPAALVSGVAFAALHPTGLSSLLPLTMVGCISALLCYQRGSLVPCIVFHAFYNGFIFYNAQALWY